MSPVKLHAQPTVVILSTRVDESVEACFDPESRLRGNANTDGEGENPDICHILLAHGLTIR